MRLNRDAVYTTLDEQNLKSNLSSQKLIQIGIEQDFLFNIPKVSLQQCIEVYERIYHNMIYEYYIYLIS